MAKKFLTKIDATAGVTAPFFEVSETGVVDVRKIVWNAIDGTFDMGLLNGVTLQSGQEIHFYGKAVGTIGNGQAVMFAGVQGDHLLMSLADAATINANPQYFIGVATQDFVNNDFGYVTVLGKVRGLDTSARTAGAVLYFDSSSATDGLLTETVPTAPNAKIEVAAVVKVHATQGVLMVRPHIMPKISMLSDVHVSSIANNEVLTWATNRFENKSIAAILGYTPANGANYLALTGGTLTGGLYINPANSATTGLEVASNKFILRTDTSQPFSRQLTTTIGSGTLVKMQAAGYGAEYVTDLGFYTSSLSGANTLPNIYLTGGDNRVGINTITPGYTLDVNGTIGVSGVITANAFVKASGTSAQFLMADGSVSLGATATARTEQIFTATSGQTTFTVTGGYVVGLVDVYVNGVKLLPSDFTATNGSTVVLATGAVLNDSVTIINYTATIAALPTSRDTIDYTATSAQTTFTVSGGYVVGLLDVYVNGVKLTSSEYTAINGTTFVLTVASVTGDQVQAIRYNASVNGVSGSGTANYIPKFTASGTLGNSLIQDDGTNVTIGSTNSSLLMTRAATSNNAVINFASGGTTLYNIGLKSIYGTDDFYIWNAVTGYSYMTLSATSSLANFGVSIRAQTFTSYTNSGVFMQNSSAGTSSVHMRLNNTGGDLRMGIDSSAGGGFQTGTSAYAAVFGNQANYATQFTTNGTVRMTIAAGGNVGINTSSPGAALDVVSVIRASNSATSGFASANIQLAAYNGSSVAISGSIFQTSSTFAYQQIAANQTNIYGTAANGIRIATANAPIIFNTGASDADFSTERMRITSSGNVGIGTSVISQNFGGYTHLDIGNATTGGILLFSNAGGTNYGYVNGEAGGLNMRATVGNLTFNTGATERMRITSTGVVAIGTSSNVGQTGETFLVAGDNGVNTVVVRRTGASNTNASRILFQAINASSVVQNTGIIEAGLENSSTAGYLAFFSSTTERMRITSGGFVLIGTTTGDPVSTNTAGIAFEGALGSGKFSRNNNACIDGNRIGSDGELMRMYRGGTQVGNISVTGSSTSYNTSSDYRLKEDLKSINGLEIVNKIKVYDYKWKANDSRMDGVLAHELAEIIPYAVHGVKDGEEMQGVDYSKIVPVMVQAIKDLKAELDLLKNN